MEFKKLISDRYSVREFKPEHLKKEDLDIVLDSGHKAPTGCNNQPQRILVLNTDESIIKLQRCTKCHFNAPSAMLVCYNRDESWIRPYDKALSAPVDSSIVATHMMLAAYDIGVGCCWVMHFDPVAIREEFNIPENFEPVALLVMGYPAANSKPRDMHFKFREIDDVVFYDKF